MASVAAASSTKFDYELVTILKLGERCSIQYPAFLVFTISLKYLDDGTVVFDGCPELVRSYPALLSGYTAMDS